MAILLRAALAALALVAAIGTAGAEPVKIFAAASLKNALDAVAQAWTARDATKSIVASYAASSALAKQIEQGAPADLFLSADNQWMDYLAEKNLIKPETRKALLGNALVLIAPKGAGGQVELKPGVDLSAMVGDGKLAVAGIKAVPAGRYAKAALDRLGLFAVVEAKLVQSENVRAALLLVARGEAKFGIVYATDARAEPNVEVVATFPENSHPPIVYPVAVVASATNPDAAAFVAFLASPEAGDIFAKQGFVVLR
jgi:molybdate transport system substrate-binding protein